MRAKMSRNGKSILQGVFSGSPCYFFFFFLVLAIRNRFRMRPPLMHVENTCVEVGELA